MAESSSHNPSSPEITPKEEPVTLDKHKSPNPFLPADQVKFSFEERSPSQTNNEVALRYPYHPKIRILLRLTLKIWVPPTSRIKGDINITSFRNALRAHYLPHSSMYVPPPSIAVVRSWFAIIRYSGEIRAKRTLKKSFLPPRWRLLMAQIIQCLDYAKLIWEDIIHKLNKKTREKVVPY
ncbi:hypothetical protein Tco_0757227 [Tanacetum coccineum]